MSDFVRSAVEERIEQVLRDHDSRTVVPDEFFDQLLAALDSPARPNEALARAARMSRDLVAGG